MSMRRAAFRPWTAFNRCRRCGPVTSKGLSVEYKRNGVVSLFAALQVHKGTVQGMVTKPHTHVEFLMFLKQLNRAYQGVPRPRGDEPTRSAARH